MWTKQPQTEAPGSSPSQASGFPSAPSIRTSTAHPTDLPKTHPASPTARGLSCLGSSLTVKGKISGDEDLQIDGTVEGQISLKGHRLTVGRTGQLNSEVTARELIVYGKVIGNLHAQDRAEIKTDGSVIGDISTSRISIEDGAYVKGRIEIDRDKSSAARESVIDPVAEESYSQ
jgi:cytoskeletal protein CcmA (bactofilin family)